MAPINLRPSHGNKRLREFLEAIRQFLHVFGDHGGGWDVDRRQKCLKLYLSMLGKPHDPKHKREMFCFLLPHLGCVLVHSRVKGTDRMCDPGQVTSSIPPCASFPGRQ